MYPWSVIAWTAAAFVFVSPVWVESDAYRYAAGTFLLFGLIDYYRHSTPRPPLGAIGWLCLAWAAYVAARYGLVLAGGPERVGSAEGLYLFPLGFSTLGYAWWRLCDRLAWLPDAFLAASLVMLAGTIDFPAVLAGERTPFLIQNNTIHASVAAGLIAIGATAVLHRALTGSPQRFREIRAGVALCVVALCLVGIFGAKSKGVWLAVAVALPLQAAWLIARLPRRAALPLAAGALAAVALGLVLAGRGLITEAGPHLASIAALGDAVGRNGLDATLHAAIGDADVPFSLRERLALWGNALALWSDAPLFGWGAAWIDGWKQAPFGTVHYNLIHNGYLEIAIRYGLFGLGVFAAMWIAFAAWILRAYRLGLVGEAAVQLWAIALVFFALTLLSNSNNRLAIGEMFILASAAFGFRCWFALAQAKRRMA